jgi:DNA-binding NarL/FixJ family response regulator
MMAKIVLADEHPVVRCGLRFVLSAVTDMSVVGEAGDCMNALRLVEHFQPDILLLGLIFAGATGLEIIRQTKKFSRRTRPVVLSSYLTDAGVWEALSSGAIAYIHKSAPPDEIIKGLREALSDRPYLSPEVADFTSTSVLQMTTTNPFDLYQTLTDREREMLQLCAEGHSGDRAIGALLGISPRTVEAHRGNLMRKLGFRRFSEVIGYAVERRLILKQWPKAALRFSGNRARRD